MSEFFVGQQVVINDSIEGDLMGTVRLVNTEKIAVQVEGDPNNIVHWERPENVRSYVDIYTQTNPAPNVFIGPSSDWIVKGLVTKWLNEVDPTNPKLPLTRDYPFDENDSFSWTVREMLDLEERLSND